MDISKHAVFVTEKYQSFLSLYNYLYPRSFENEFHNDEEKDKTVGDLT